MISQQSRLEVWSELCDNIVYFFLEQIHSYVVYKEKSFDQRLTARFKDARSLT